MIKDRMIKSISCKHKYVFIGNYGKDKTPLERCEKCGTVSICQNNKLVIMFRNLKKFLPIRIHHIKYSYGWWIGDKFIFFEKHWIPFNIMPICCEHHRATFANNGHAIEDGDVKSWDRYYEQFKE